MRVEAKYVKELVRYKNLDEFNAKFDEYLKSGWRLEKYSVEADLSVLACYEKCTSGRDIITLKNALSMGDVSRKVVVKTEGKIVFTGEAYNFVGSDIILFKQLLRKVVREHSNIEGVDVYEV